MNTRKVKDAIDLETKEKVYLKGHAKVTYMSNGRTVEDAINSIGTGGGSGGGSVEIPIIEHGENDTTMTIEPNSYHKWGEVGELTISLGEPTNLGVVNEYMFSFVNTSLTPRLTIDELMWEYGEYPSFSFFAKNVVKIMDGHAKIESYSLAGVLLMGTYDYNSEEEMIAQRFANILYSGNYVPGEYPIGNESICVWYDHEYDDEVIEDFVTSVFIPVDDYYDRYYLLTSQGHMFALNNNGTITFVGI